MSANTVSNSMVGLGNISTGSIFNPQWCQYKVPCGYCEKLGRDYPKQVYTYYSGGPAVVSVGLDGTSPVTTYTTVVSGAVDDDLRELAKN